MRGTSDLATHSYNTRTLGTYSILQSLSWHQTTILHHFSQTLVHTRTRNPDAKRPATGKSFASRGGRLPPLPSRARPARLCRREGRRPDPVRDLQNHPAVHHTRCQATVRRPTESRLTPRLAPQHCRSSSGGRRGGECHSRLARPREPGDHQPLRRNHDPSLRHVAWSPPRTDTWNSPPPGSGKLRT